MNRLLRTAALSLLLVLAAALGARDARGGDAESVQYVSKGTFLQVPALRPLPPPTRSEVADLPPVEGELLPTPEAEEEEVEGLVDIDLLPGPDDLFLKGEEALMAVEQLGVVDSWVIQPLRLWSASFEFGVSGSSGNNDVLDLRVAAHVKRKTPHRRFTGDLNYKTVSQGAERITDRLFAEARHEWLFGQSPWSPYVHGTTEYDRVRAFGVRLNLDAGVGYRFFDDEISSLLARFGAGASSELNSREEEPLYEAVFGVDYERRLTERQRFAASADYFPGWEDFNTYRLNIKASWEVNLDQEGHLSLKLGIVDRYDSTPGEVEPNDLDYAATLLWSF